MANETKGKFEVIYAILNAGFADQAMLAAREAGAKGGTIIHARGSSNIGVDDDPCKFLLRVEHLTW